jgi:ABC-2 type transport system permease protein
MAELTAFSATGPLSRPASRPGSAGVPAARRLPSTGSILLAQVRYQFMLLVRTPRALVGGVILPALLLIVSHVGKGPVAPAGLAGLAVLGVTLTAWSTNGITLVAARESGVLKRWRATPLPPWCYFVARITATVVVSALAGAVTLAIGILLYHTHLTAAGVLGALLTLVLVSGVFGGLGGEPHWLTTLLSGHDIAVLACWTVAGLLAARVLFRWQPSRPTSRGRSRASMAGWSRADHGS